MDTFLNNIDIAKCQYLDDFDLKGDSVPCCLNTKASFFLNFIYQVNLHIFEHMQIKR